MLNELTNEELMLNELTNEELIRIAKLEKENHRLKDELLKLTNTFDVEAVKLFFNYIDDNPKELFSLWEDKVKKRTNMLKSVEEVGIKIFSDNIGHQDELSWQPKEIKVVFDPDPALPKDESWKNNPKFAVNGKFKYVGDSRLVGDRETISYYIKVKPRAGAVTPNNADLIHLFEEQKPNLKEQLYSFVMTGRMHKAVSKLTHELIHKSHQKENPDIEKIITETQAYTNDVIDPISNFESISSLVKHIHKDYDLPQGKVQSIIENIVFLYSAGYNTKAVSDMLANFNSSIDEAWFLEEHIVKPMLNKKKINNEEKKVLVSNYILQRRVDVQKSRQMFIEAFGEWMEGE